MNNSGKTMVIFMVVIAVMLAALAAIFAFYLVKEVELRKTAETKVEQMQMMEEKLKAEREKLEKQITKLDDQIEENTKTIEGLMAEVDLQEGLKEEFKEEKTKLKEEKKALEEKVKTADQEKEQIREEMGSDLTQAEDRIAGLEKMVEELRQSQTDLRRERDEIEKNYQQLKDKIDELSILPDAGLTGDGGPGGEGVTLPKIVVVPKTMGGTVISVDHDAEFVIVSLGEANGVEDGDVLSVLRDGKELGRVKVTRVLPNMSAADFVPPMTSKDVWKDDQVKQAP